MDEPNVYAGRKEPIVEGFSNTPPGDQEPTEFDDWLNQPITTHIVAATLSIWGVQVLGEQEWEDGLCRVLEEMTEEGLRIFQDRRVQIEIRDYDCSLVWAFPLNQQAWIADYFQVKPTTQIMLMISADRVEQRPTALYQKVLRHQLGHILWALRNCKWCNECYRATREWKKWCK